MDGITQIIADVQQEYNGEKKNLSRALKPVLILYGNLFFNILKD